MKTQSKNAQSHTPLTGFENLRGDIIAVDTEGTGLNPYGDRKRWGFYPARPFAFSFTDLHGNSAYVRFPVDSFTRRVQYEKDPRSLLRVRAFLMNPNKQKIFHNVFYDSSVIHRIPIPMVGPYHDTMIMMHVATGGSELSYGLKQLCKKYCDFGDEDQKALIDSVNIVRRNAKEHGWCIADKEYNRVPAQADYFFGDPDLVREYAIKDTERTSLLYLMSWEDIQGDPGLLETYQREMKVFPVLLRASKWGMRIRINVMDELEILYKKHMATQIQVADGCGGKGLNFRSSKQMQKLFYEERKYPVRYGKSGRPTLDKKTLEVLSDKDPLAKAIMEYRAASHVISGFYDPYRRNCTEEEKGTWVIHPNFRQVGTVTGRLSSSDPNVMNVADEISFRKGAAIAPRVREVFSPRDGYVWYLPDYRQIELWIFATAANEHKILDALMNEDRDFPTEFATAFWGDRPDFKSNFYYYRTRGKSSLYAKFYGAQAKKMAEIMGLNVSEAVRWLQQFDQTYSSGSLFMKRLVNGVARTGELRNLYGRKYYIHPRQAYMAVNYFIQGTAADVLKGAISRIPSIMQRYPGVEFLTPIHDEIVFEVPVRWHSKKLMREIRDIMVQDWKRIGLPQPLQVKMKVAREKWSHPEEVKL